MVTKVVKAKKVNKKPNPKNNSLSPANKVQKPGKVGNPKKQKQQLENVKKAVGAKILKTPAPKKGNKSNAKVQKKKGVGTNEESDSVSEEDTQNSAMAESDSVSEEDTQDSAMSESNSVSKKHTKFSAKADNTIVVRYARSAVTEADLKETFSICGDVESVVVLKGKNTQNCLGLGFVEFNSPDSVDAALEIKTAADGDTKINVERYILGKKKNKKTPKPKPIKTIVSNTNNTVFVKDLKPTANKGNIKKFFLTCGKIEYINFRRSRVGKETKARAFICFKSNDSIGLALKLNDTIFDGEPIHIEEYSVQPKKEEKTQFKKPQGDTKVTKSNENKKKPAPAKANSGEKNATGKVKAGGDAAPKKLQKKVKAAKK